jgi:hypothetical protein
VTHKNKNMYVCVYTLMFVVSVARQLPEKVIMIEMVSLMMRQKLLVLLQHMSFFIQIW